MIKLDVTYKPKEDTTSVKYSSKSSNTFEHLYGIICLLGKIEENDPTFNLKETIKMIEEMYNKRRTKK